MMTSRCKLQNLSNACVGASSSKRMPCWLVTPRSIGPVAAAIRWVHLSGQSVHPLGGWTCGGRGGGRRKLLFLNGFLASVHPSTPRGTVSSHMRTHADTWARVCARTHGRSLPTHMWSGWTGGRIEYSCGFATSTLRPHPVHLITFCGV